MSNIIVGYREVLYILYRNACNKDLPLNRRKGREGIRSRRKSKKDLVLSCQLNTIIREFLAHLPPLMCTFRTSTIELAPIITV
jgi:hypothetical protein